MYEAKVIKRKIVDNCSFTVLETKRRITSVRPENATKKRFQNTLYQFRFLIKLKSILMEKYLPSVKKSGKKITRITYGNKKLGGCFISDSEIKQERKLVIITG